MVVAMGKLLGSVDFPPTEASFERREPFSQAGFPSIDLLPSSNQTNDDAPSVMTIHHAAKEFGFRHLKICLTLLLAHKVCQMLRVPRTLRLIEYRNPLNRWLRRHKIGVAKMHDVLNKAFHFPGSFGFLAFLAPFLRLRVFISR